MRPGPISRSIPPLQRCLNACSWLCLPLIAAFAFTTAVVAQTDALTQPTRLPYTPATLVNAAYNGRLKAQGIPSFADLVDDILMDDIEAEDLVEAAIAQGRLTAATLEDRRFLNTVNARLRDLLFRNGGD